MLLLNSVLLLLNPVLCECVVFRDKTFFHKSKSLYAVCSCSILFCVGIKGKTEWNFRFRSHSHSVFSSGDWTRTSDLRVMSPTSYQLLHPAIYLYLIFLIFALWYTRSHQLGVQIYIIYINIKNIKK